MRSHRFSALSVMAALAAAGSNYSASPSSSTSVDPDEYERREQMSRQRGGFGGGWLRRRFKQNARKAR